MGKFKCVTIVYVAVLLLISCDNNKTKEIPGFKQEFYQSGMLKSKTQIKNGIYHGVSKSYYESGKIINVCNYKEGVRVGVNQVYYENGQVKIIEHFNDNGELEGLWQSFYESGNLKCRGSFSKDLKIGKWESFYENQVLYGVDYYKDGKNNGEHILYHENGEVAVKYFYNFGVKEGVWTYFDTSGDILKIEEYLDDRLVKTKVLKASKKSNLPRLARFCEHEWSKDFTGQNKSFL